MMWLAAGFGALGLLIGTLVAFTSETVVSSSISLLFAFVGGSVLVMLHKLSREDRRVAGASIFCLSLFCVGSLYGGVYVYQHRLLSPPAVRKNAEAAMLEDTSETYLRSGKQNRANQIDGMLQEKNLTLEQAYKQMYELALELSNPPSRK